MENSLSRTSYSFPLFHECVLIFLWFCFFIFIAIITKNCWEIKRRNEKLRNFSSENVFHVWPTFKCLPSLLSSVQRNQGKKLGREFSNNFNSSSFGVFLASDVHFPESGWESQKGCSIEITLGLDSRIPFLAKREKLNHTSNSPVGVRFAFGYEF